MNFETYNKDEIVLVKHRRVDSNGNYMGNISTHKVEDVVQTKNVNHQNGVTTSLKLRSENNEFVDYFDRQNNHTNTIASETIPQKFRNLMLKKPDFKSFMYKSDASMDHFDKCITFNKYYEIVKNVGRSFIKLGLDCNGAVCILGFNSVAWFTSQMGTIFSGARCIGLYPTNGADTNNYMLEDSGCNILVVELSAAQLDKDASAIMPSKFGNGLPDSVKAVVFYSGSGGGVNSDKLESMRLIVQRESRAMKEKMSAGNVQAYWWDDFLALTEDEVSSKTEQDEMDRRIKCMQPDECCMLVYTSGTTGRPKGVMLTHDNLIFATTICNLSYRLEPYQHSLITYLPLSHIAGNLMDVMATFIIGITVYFAQPDALKGSLGKTLKEVRPTMFLGVPRVFEKIKEQMQEVGMQTKGLKLKYVNWAKSIGYESSIKKINGKHVGFCYCVANILFRKIKKVIGLDRCKYFLSGAAPLTRDTQEYFMRLDIRICQIYGMSECSGPATLCLPHNMKLGSAGTLLKGTEIKLNDCDEEGNGEICMRGRHVFKGYWKAEEKTREVIDEQGWLRSGDIGRYLGSDKPDGPYLFITGRLKEIIITAGGENVAPVPVEDAIKVELPFISNVMLIGDKKKFISCFITLKTIINTETMTPTNQLTPLAVKDLKVMCGIDEDIKTVDDVLNILETPNNSVASVIDKAIACVNKKSVSRAAMVQKWKLLSCDFSIPGGELGPTMKLKRPVVMKMYAREIDSLYL